MKLKQNNDQKSNFGKWGWLMIFICFFSYYIGGGLGTDGANIYLSALSENKGYSQAALLLAGTYGGWINIVTILLYAKVVQKIGTRRLHGTLTIIAGLAYIALGNFNNLAAACAMRVVITLAAGGFGSFLCNTFMNNWFPRKKGLALGWATMGLPFATMTGPDVSFGKKTGRY